MIQKNKQMKKFFLPIILFTVLINSCSKDIVENNLEFPALQPASTDINAGVWKPILLTGPTEFPVPAPIAVTTPDYIAQINEIKTWQADLSKDEKRIVQYWSAGAVLRWNEIMRELVAKHNLPPYQNPDGTYPAPNANNPLAYPQFPFANPPYASRAYAYLAAAEYDALVAAWHYKKLYNRAAPYITDATINALIPKSDLPSYPSEDAVVAGVASEMMKLLFPGDQDFIQQKIEEHKKARLIAGANVRSDLDAGEALGKAVAQKHIADFWDDNPFKLNVVGHVNFVTKKFSPPGHWMNIVGIGAKAAKADFKTTVAAYAQTAIALYDAFISCWDEKFRSNYVRPETMINKIDENWHPYIQTPPFPSYTSGHATNSAAAAEVMTHWFGDNLSFTDTSLLEFGIKNREIKSFRAAAEEAAMSRLYGGIHYRFDNENGTIAGKKLGEFIVTRLRLKK